MPYTKVETFDLSTLLEKVIKVSNITERLYGKFQLLHKALI